MNTNDESKITDQNDAVLIGLAELTDHASIYCKYYAQCLDSNSALKWQDEVNNLVPTLGKNANANATLDNTAAGAVHMGLKGTGTVDVADTQSSHAGWLEVGATNAPAYKVGGSAVRATPTYGAAVAGVKTVTAAQTFVFTSAGTIAGLFINIGGTTAIDNTTGVLFSAGNFTLGSKTVTAGDQLLVTNTLTIT